MAGLRRIALAAGAVCTLAAVTSAAVLIAMLVNHPDQILLAMDNGDVLDLVALILRRVASVYLGVLRML